MLLLHTTIIINDFSHFLGGEAGWGCLQEKTIYNMMKLCYVSLIINDNNNDDDDDTILLSTHFPPKQN